MTAVVLDMFVVWCGVLCVLWLCAGEKGLDFIDEDTRPPDPRLLRLPDDLGKSCQCVQCLCRGVVSKCATRRREVGLRKSDAFKLP